MKEFIVHKGLNVCERIIGKHLLRKVEDIPDKSWNNHQRIWLDCWMKSLDDMWVRMIRQQGLLKKDPVKRKKVRINI